MKLVKYFALINGKNKLLQIGTKGNKTRLGGYVHIINGRILKDKPMVTILGTTRFLKNNYSTKNMASSAFAALTATITGNRTELLEHTISRY